MRLHKRRRGSALILALFFLTLLGLLATAMTRLLPVELNSATRANRDLASFYAAGAGVEGVLARLKTDYGAGIATPSSFTLTGPVGTEWRYEAVATALSGVGTYKVVSRAFPVPDQASPPKPVRQVTAFIQDKYLSDYNIFGEGQVAWNLRYKVEGPVYGGDQLQFWVERDRWGENFASFNSVVTTSGAQSSSNIDWKGPGGAATTDAQWNNVTTSGQAGVIYNYKSLSIPTTNFVTKALPSGTTAPNQAGLYVPSSGGTTNGGVFIKGQVKDMNLTLDGANNQVMTVKLANGGRGPALTDNTGAGGTDWKVVFAESATTLNGTSIPANSTAILKPGVATPIIYTGVTNGLVAVDGRIGDGNPANTVGGLSGTVKGDRTITSTDEIDVDGPLMRKDILDLQNPASSDPRYRDPVTADPPLRIPTPADPDHMDNLTVYATSGIVLDLDEFPSNSSNQQVANVYGLLVTRGGFSILHEQGNASGAINFLGAVAQTQDWHHDQFVDANAGGGNNNWTVDFMYDSALAYKPNAFLPGLGLFSVKAYSEDPLP